jgi:hemoglobin
MNAQPATIYEQVGGFEAFRRLVDAFYDGVESDAVLRPLYPESLDGPREHLSLFLAQYFGGPATYSEQRGHPRLRMRHFPFAIGRRERDAWVAHMLEAVDSTGVAEPARSEMREYFQNAATFLINRESPRDEADRIL